MKRAFTNSRGLFLLAALLLCLLAEVAWAQEDALTKYKKSLVDELPERVEKALDHLLEAASDTMVRLDPEQLKPLLAFVADNVVDPDRLDMERRFGSKGMCQEFDLDVSLPRLLEYLANPEIPYNLLMPGLVSLNTMEPGSDLLRLETPLWERVDGLEEPIILRGVEHEASVPTVSSGGWYAYELNRLMVLMTYRGRPVLVQASVQPDRSSVGRKGVALDKGNWLYFLSGESGLNRSGLGWADTYIYESAGVYVFMQEPSGKAIHGANLKWLSAGWKGINAVGREDLLDGAREGIEAFGRVFSSWPEPEVLAAIGTWSEGLSGAELDRLGRAYALDFEKLAKANEAMDDDDFLEEIENGGYAKVLSPDALRAQLAVERLKCLLGRPSLGGLCDEPLPLPVARGLEAEAAAQTAIPAATPADTATEAPAQ